MRLLYGAKVGFLIIEQFWLKCFISQRIWGVCGWVNRVQRFAKMSAVSKTMQKGFLAASVTTAEGNPCFSIKTPRDDNKSWDENVLLKNPRVSSAPTKHRCKERRRGAKKRDRREITETTGVCWVCSSVTGFTQLRQTPLTNLSTLPVFPGDFWVSFLLSSFPPEITILLYFSPTSEKFSRLFDPPFLTCLWHCTVWVYKSYTTLNVLNIPTQKHQTRRPKKRIPVS